MAKQSVQVWTSCSRQKQRRRAALLAPPAEDRLARRPVRAARFRTGRTGRCSRRNRLVVAGDGGAVEHDGDQAVAERLLQLLHELRQQLVHECLYQSLEAPPPPKSPPPKPPKPPSPESVPAETAAAAAAPGRAAHHVAENQPGQEPAATRRPAAISARPAGAHQPDQQEDAADDDRPRNANRSSCAGCVAAESRSARRFSLSRWSCRASPPRRIRASPYCCWRSAGRISRSTEPASPSGRIGSSP